MLFGDVTISSEELAAVLCRDVRAKVNDHPRNPNNRVWTDIVYEVLYREGTQLGYQVYCSRIGACHEWLLDVVWWNHTRGGEVGIVLAVECEWDCKDLMWDFQKLLCTKAPLKVFIYDGGNTPQYGRKERKQLEQEMLAYRDHVEGETYLFVSFGDTGQYAHRFVVPKDGALETIEFETLSEVPNASYAAAL